MTRCAVNGKAEGGWVKGCGMKVGGEVSEVCAVWEMKGGVMVDAARRAI